MNDTLPPSDITAEQSVLGCILIQPECLDAVREIITTPEDFYLPKNSAVFQAILAVGEKGERIDSVTVTGKLADMGAIKEAGGVEPHYITDCIQYVPHAEGAEHYARMVREKADRRRLIDFHERCLSSAYNDPNPPSHLIDSSVNTLIELKASEKSCAAHVGEWLTEAMEDDRPRVFTGMHALDEVVGGFEMGTMSIVGARPSMGKTAFGASMCVNLAHAGKPTGFVSAEMKGRRIGRRFACAEAGISTTEFEEQKHTAQVQATIDSMQDWPVWIDETSGQHVDRVCGRIRRWHREHDIQCAMIDYLQLLSSDKETEYENCVYISKKLKALSQELDIALIVLAQLNRGNTQRPDKKPVMSDLRGSGTIEQDADYILLLHRESYYQKESDPLNPLESIRDNEAEIIVEKSRDGATGIAHVGWVGKCGLFTSGQPVGIDI